MDCGIIKATCKLNLKKFKKGLRKAKIKLFFLRIKHPVRFFKNMIFLYKLRKSIKGANYDKRYT